MFSSDRNELRKKFFDAWQKHQNNLPIEPLEAQLINIILLHPEYHAILNDSANYQAKDFTENNPFLHMSLHLAIREQINTNRPIGINSIYQNHCKKLQDSHLAEHYLMECLMKMLWQAQQNGVMPSEETYQEMCRQPIK